MTYDSNNSNNSTLNSKANFTINFKSLLKLIFTIFLINSLTLSISAKKKNPETEEEKEEDQEIKLPKNFEEEDFNLIQINSENFKETVLKENIQHFLLLIHNPWCKYSQKLNEKLLAVHKILKMEKQDYYIGSLDASIENAEKFIEKFVENEHLSINSFYPKLIYFQNGKAMDIYNGRQSRDAVLNYIKRKIYPESISFPLLNIFDYKILHDKNAFILVDNLLQKDNVSHKEKLTSKEGFELFNKISSKFHDSIFYHTNDKKIANYLFEKNPNFKNETIYKRDFNILYFSKGKLKDVYLNNKLKIMFEKSLNHFISKHTRNNFFTNFNEDAINEIFIKKQPAFFLFRNIWDNSTSHLEENLPLLASQDPNMKFILSDITSKYTLKLINLLLVTPEDLPTARIIDFNGGFRRFDNRIKANEVMDVMEFVKSYKEGKLKPYYSSNINIEKESKYGIMDIGNGNFFEKVVKPNRNVIVFYYTKWCSHCKKVNFN